MPNRRETDYCDNLDLAYKLLCLSGVLLELNNLCITPWKPALPVNKLILFFGKCSSDQSTYHANFAVSAPGVDVTSH
jgi:hypothetical protein